MVWPELRLDSASISLSGGGSTAPTHQKPTIGLSLVASASRSALVSMTGAATRDAGATEPESGAVGAKERAAELMDSISGCLAKPRVC